MNHILLSFGYSILFSLFITTGIYRLTGDVWTTLILGFGLWGVVSVIFVGLTAITYNVETTKKGTREIVELLEKAQRDRENHR